MAKRNTYFQDEIIEKKIDIKQLGRTLKYVLPFKHIFILVGVLMLIGTAVALISPLLIKHIVNVVVPNEDYRMLAVAIVGMAVLAAIEIAITYFQHTLMGQTGHSIIANIRKEIFYKLQELPFDYFDSRPNGKITVRVTSYIDELANFFTNYVLLFLIYCIRIVVVTFFMLGMSVQLTGIVFAVVIPLMASVCLLRYKIRKRYAKNRAMNSNRTAFLVESIMGEKIVKNYNRVNLNQQIHKEVNDNAINTFWKIVLLNEFNGPIVEIFWNLGTLLLYGISLLLILGGNSAIDAGVVIVFTTYMGHFNGPLTQIAVIIQQLSSVTANLEQVFDTIDTPVAIRDEKDAVVHNDVKGSVDFCDVTFAYEEGVNILEHFDLHVNPGETIALVGPTGAGKTTVISMLTRFYDVQAGAVKIDGVDVKEANLESLRREVGVLMQDPFIFKGTVMENIRYGRPDATDEECIAAAKAIYADKCIDKLKDGYYHELDERGNGLSEGEKQMISFARIVLKNPSLIILDEATSSIDTETENLIQKALEVLLKGKTAFIVAHRLSTIRNADRILYIADKGIAEQGNHRELMEKKGLYYRLNCSI